MRIRSYFCGMSTPPPPNEENDSPKEHSIDTQNNQKSPIRFFFRKSYNSRADWHLVLATYLLGIGTLALAWYARDQAKTTRNAIIEQSMRDSTTSVRDSVRNVRDSIRTVATLDSTGIQLSIAKETMRKQLRAYVYVEIDTFISFANHYYIAFSIKNSGTTPAYGVSLWHTGGYRYLKRNMSFAKVVSDTPDVISNAPLNPGSKNMNFYEEFSCDTVRQSLGIDRGVAAIFFYGCISYKDVFGFNHNTPYRLRFMTTNGKCVPYWTEDGNDPD
jgi:hypothetical protein